MAFKHKSGRTKTMWLPKAVATLIRADGVVKFNGIGGVVAALSDTAEAIFGVAKRAYATSDTTTDLIAIEVPTEIGVEWEFDTDSDGGLTDTMVGTSRDLDTNGDKVDVSLTADKTILVTRCISATKGIGVFSRNALAPNFPLAS